METEVDHQPTDNLNLTRFYILALDPTSYHTIIVTAIETLTLEEQKYYYMTHFKC
jgi:hypothetical protein